MKNIYLFLILFLILFKTGDCKSVHDDKTENYTTAGSVEVLRIDFIKLAEEIFNEENTLIHFDRRMGLWGDWFGPARKEDPFMKENPFTIERLNRLEIELYKRIVGQDVVIKAVLNKLKYHALGLPATGPLASLLFAGPTGVGKTQLVNEIAEGVFGDQSRIIKIDMADYASAFSKERLMGSSLLGFLGPEGDLPGLLEVAFKKSPYAIILLEDIDKAEPEILDVFTKIFENGIVTDRNGRLIDCRKCVFISTTSLAGGEISTLHDLGTPLREITRKIEPILLKSFSPSFYNQLEVLIFTPFKENVLDSLIKVLLDKCFSELAANLGIEFDYDQSLVDYFKNQNFNYTLGARPLEQNIRKITLMSLMEAIKKGYLFFGDQAVFSYSDRSIHIRSNGRDEDFKLEQMEAVAQLTPPFNFENVLNLENLLNRKVIGQPSAINMTVSALKRYAAGFVQANAPIGAFLYIGPTGVGKTELAKELARQLLGSESHLIRLDMSEYSDQSSTSRLIGSPPGYVNHEEGGQLTEAIKRNPYAIILLDEIEKAHSIVRKVFLQIFDEGRITDAKGVLIDCRNVIFICTTNLGAEKILNFDSYGYDDDEILESIRSEVIEALAPELYNRLEPVLFKGLGSEFTLQLVDKLLLEVQADLIKAKNIHVEFDERLKDFLVLHGFDYELGARPLKRLIQQRLVTEIATAVISKEVEVGDYILIGYEDEKVVIKKIACR